MRALIALIFLASTAWSQSSINSYKYILLPKQFSFLRGEDQYGLNSTARSLLEQKGFTVLWTNGDLPASIATNKCSALVAEVTQRKAMFTTNLTMEIKDCTGNILFKTKEGKSREKEFFMAYDEALRDALSSLNTLSYKYDSTQVVQSQPQSQPQSQTQPQSQPQQSTTQIPQQPIQTTSPATSPALAGILYAQPIPNGYQLVDMTPKKVLTLLKTSTPDYYIARSETANGIVFKKDGQWRFDYYKDEQLVSLPLEIKF